MIPMPPNGLKSRVAAPNLILAPTQPPTPLQVLPLLTPLEPRWYSTVLVSSRTVRV